MAIYDLIFGSARKEDPRQVVSPIEKPTGFQKFFGTGKYMRELGTQRDRVQKEYLSDLHNFRKQRHVREREFEKTMEKQRKYYFGQKAGRWDLVDKDPTPTDLQDQGLRHVAERFEDTEKHMNRSFKESERKGEEQINRGFKDKLGQVAKDVRGRTVTGGFSSPNENNHRTFLQHAVGLNKADHSQRRAA